MASRRLAPLLAALAALALAGCATPHGATLSEFETTLAAQDSATAALGQWCAARHIADPARIRALPVAGGTPAPPPDLRARLGIGADEPLGYRHVRLVCGDAVLSEAHNWFVPARLPPEMNAALSGSDTPFGKLVAQLGFTRERLTSLRGRAPGCPKGTLLSHRALLRLPDGRPISLVVECYTRVNLVKLPSSAK